MTEKFSGDALAALRHKFRKTAGASVSDRMASEAEDEQKADGRSMRRTGRTEQIAVRVTAETKAEYQAYAQANGILMAEVLEMALAALKAQDAAHGHNGQGVNSHSRNGKR